MHQKKGFLLVLVQMVLGVTQEPGCLQAHAEQGLKAASDPFGMGCFSDSVYTFI